MVVAAFGRWPYSEADPAPCVPAGEEEHGVVRAVGLIAVMPNAQQHAPVRPRLGTVVERLHHRAREDSICCAVE
jgi:hypothetical protein